MEARLQESLSQEGTGMSGESLPESDSGSPTYSGRGNILPTHNVETITLDDDDNETIIVEDDDSDTTKEPIRPKLNIRNSSDGTESEPSTSGLQNKLTNKNQYIEITNLTRKLGILTDNMIKLVDNNPTTIKELKNGIWDIKNHLDCLNERLRESGEDLPCSEDVATQTQNMDLIDDIKAKIRTKDVSEILDTDWPEEVYTAVTVEKGDLDTIDSDCDVVVIVMPKTETDEASELEKRLLTKRPEANGLLQGIEAGAVKFVLCTVLQIERCTFVLPCALTVADMLTQFISLHKKSNELSRPGKFAVFVESSLNVTNTRKIIEAAFSGSGSRGKILIEKDIVDVERPEKRKSETVTTEEVMKKAKNDVTAVDSKEAGITVESVQMVIKELAEAGWGEFLGEELPFKLDVANIGVPNTINNMPSTSGMGRNEQGSHLEEIVSNTLETARNAGHPRLQGMVGAGTSAGLQRSYIWSGVIEWMEKGKTPGDQQKTTKHLHCQVSASTKDIEPELKVDTWPNKLLMQLMPKQLISNIGGQYLKDSKSVLFHLQPSEALDALTKVMVNGFAGCVHFSQIPSPPQCDIKVLILLYTPDKKAYLGFIPNNQATFVDRLRKVIQQQKISQIISKQQIPAPVSAAGGLPPNMATSTMAGTGAMPTPGMSSGGMGAGMSSGMQPVSVGNVGNVGQMPGPGPSQGMVQTQMQQHPQGMMISGGMGGQVQQVGGKGPRPVTQLDGLEAARQQNLEKIQHLQQTLEAAHQQEAQFKSQMDIMSHLHAAQQQEQHYKQLEEQRKHQLQQQLQQQLRGNTAHQPRIMHPRNILPSNPGLRHLLQQQPQYRAGGGAPRPSSQPQQFDDVTNYTDFI